MVYGHASTRVNTMPGMDIERFWRLVHVCGEVSSLQGQGAAYMYCLFSCCFVCALSDSRDSFYAAHGLEENTPPPLCANEDVESNLHTCVHHMAWISFCFIVSVSSVPLPLSTNLTRSAHGPVRAVTSATTSTRTTSTSKSGQIW